MSENQHVDPLEDTRAESIRPGKLLAGAPIGGYELQHVLGEGGMGVVWCAHDPLLDRTIAIKVLKSRDVAASMRTRLLREAQAMAQIKHPNVLTVHRVGTEADRDFIVMELVDGGPLDHWLAFGPPEHEVMEALLAAGRGLAAAHAAGLVHRDFKPNNVLRSKDGRILVTDFGLARGLGEDWTSPVGPSGSLDPDASATSPSSRDSGRAPGTRDSGRGHDNVLDSPLTKTGALIGTPAYMAPEQFTGAEPDPRTDQFAYCITAWQALTGARPHFGRTLEELRQAASAGVASVVTVLDKQMRAVLTRGLEPDPGKRWPDMPTLLRELERASTPKKSRLPWIAGGVVAAIAIAVIAFIATRSAPAPICAPVETVWADAWTPGKLDTPRSLAAVLDDRRTRWLAAYDQTCKAATRPEGKLGCLRVVRDRVAAVADLAKDPAARAAIDPFLLLVPLEACTTKVAIAPLPDDERRARVISVLTRAIGAPGANLDTEVKAAGWPPLAAIVAIVAGTEQIRRGDVESGRARIERVVVGLDALDVRLLAFARLALLEASLRELARPESTLKAETDELSNVLTYARIAIKATGEEPVLGARLALLEAEALADHAERAPKRVSITATLGTVDNARKALAAAGDLRGVANAAYRYAEIQWRLGDPSALGDAEHAGRNAADALAEAQLPPLPVLDHLLGAIAFARNEPKTAHRWFDRAGAAPALPASETETIEGIVLGADGQPVMNAVVVAWTGELHGDSMRVITDRQTLVGDLVETRAEGKFKLRIKHGSAIVAESSEGTQRSVPMAVEPGTRDLVIKLGVVGEIAGKVDGVAGPAVDAYARFAIRDNSWSVHAPLDQGVAFRIANLPFHDKWEVGTRGRAGTATRRVIGGSVALAPATPSVIHGKKLPWPGGKTVDVVVRGTIGEGAIVWIVGAAEAARLSKRDDFEVLAENSFDSASSALVPIGSSYTDAGRGAYVAGARHAVFVGDYRAHAACVAPTADPDGKVTCKKLEPGDRAIAIDVP